MKRHNQVRLMREQTENLRSGRFMPKNIRELLADIALDPVDLVLMEDLPDQGRRELSILSRAGRWVVLEIRYENAPWYEGAEEMTAELSVLEDQTFDIESPTVRTQGPWSIALEVFRELDG